VKGALFSECAAFARRNFAGDLVLDDCGSEEHWDPDLKRQIFTQDIAIDERLFSIDVLIDRDDQPIGFVDEAEWRDCAWREMSDDEVLALVRETELVDGALHVAVRRRDPQNALRASVVETGANDETYRLEVCINPARSSIISILPADEELR